MLLELPMLNSTKASSTGGATLVLLACLSSSVTSGSESVWSVSDPAFSPLPLLDPFQSVATGAAATITRSIHDVLGTSARNALGAHGVERLNQFAKFEAGWDAPNSKPLDIRSVISFARFFEETSIRPIGVSVFMSSSGNIVINWLDKAGGLIELEFDEQGIHYFNESASDEYMLPDTDVGRTQLLKLLFDSHSISSASN
jgi:hypothetical protein